MKTIDVVAAVLLVIGGLNWGAVALFDVNAVAALFGTGALATVVYSAVALSGVWQAFQVKGIQRRWLRAPA